MLRSKRIMILTLAVALSFAAWAYAASIVVQTSTLNGTVSANNLVKTGAVVKEGQVLVYINSVAGPAPAARANTDGTVLEVLVAPGDKIVSGQAVAKIQSAR